MVKQTKHQPIQKKPYILIMLILIVVLQFYSMWQIRKILRAVTTLPGEYPLCENALR